jgi:hypothetical protein
MRVPNADQAVVPSRKITQYLLDLASPKGHDKAVVFIHFGFSMAQWEKLEIQLLKHILENDVSKVEKRGDMTIYVVVGLIETPSNRPLLLRSVWKVEHGQTAPYLVTAYPE